MLWTISVVLLVLWVLGIVNSYTLARDCRYLCPDQYHPGPENLLEK
jgi:hypothetical protein